MCNVSLAFRIISFIDLGPEVTKPCQGTECGVNSGTQETVRVCGGEFCRYQGTELNEGEEVVIRTESCTISCSK